MKQLNLSILCLGLLAAGAMIVEGDDFFYGNGGGGDNRATTVAEGRGRAIGNVLRSKGEYNVRNSEAALNYTQVESQRLDNDLKRADTYFEKRSVYRSNEYYSEEEKAAIRARNAEKRVYRHGRAGVPVRPSAQTLDPVSGKIAWPLWLGAPQFDEEREKLEKLFAERADKGGAIGYQGFQDITAVTDDMLATLKKEVRKMSSTEYIKTKKFIQALAFEARHSTA